MKTKSTSMVDITPKDIVQREARASGRIYLREDTVNLIRKRKVAKGDPVEAAKIAGILAAKNTSGILPLCHPILLTHIDIQVQLGKGEVSVASVVKAEAKTGVEMEALTAAAAALLTIWDMTKQYEKDKEGQYPTTAISEIRVEKKVKHKHAKEE